jgi:hypothetical protein
LVTPAGPPRSAGGTEATAAPIVVDPIEADPFESDEPAGSVVGVLDVADADLVRDQLAEADAGPPAPRSALLEFLIAVVPPSTGASLAYYFAGREQLDPVAWSALGGAVGFLFGWGSLLWIRRKD